jgi:putative hydrolase of the HAD superfamily
MIKNIIFDIGNVLAGFAWREFFAGMGFSKEVQERLAACTVLGPLWPEIDHGVMSEEEVIAAFKQYDPSVADEIDLAFKNLKGLLTRQKYAIPWIEELQNQGYKVYIISNIFDKVMDECADALDFMALVDGAVLSCEEKAIKPDSTIYRTLLKRYDLKAGECVFIDDQERNIIAARNLGIPGIIFENYQQAYNDLKKILLSDSDYQT